jgi:hypothetical protein
MCVWRNSSYCSDGGEGHWIWGGSCVCTEQTVTDSRKMLDLLLGNWAGVKISHHENSVLGLRSDLADTKRPLVSWCSHRAACLGSVCCLALRNLLSSLWHLETWIFIYIGLQINLFFSYGWKFVSRVKGKYILRVFENRVLRRMFGPKGDEVTGVWLHERFLLVLSLQGLLTCRRSCRTITGHSA